MLTAIGALTSTASYFLAPFARGAVHPHGCTRLLMTRREIEVEKKFVIVDEAGVKSIEQRLGLLGFQCESSNRFVDAYFDLPPPRWALSTNDVWLRYRQAVSKDGKPCSAGTWQLKRRPEQSTQTAAYEELEGLSAVETALQLTGEHSPVMTATGEVGLPENTKLTPFATFETHRSSWNHLTDEKFADLRVDLDATDFGFLVGEVETIVDDVSQIELATRRVEDLVQSLNDGRKHGVHSKGKLETYLMRVRPDHFNALIESGVMK